MVYQAPATERRDPIGAPWVLGGVYQQSPVWTDAPDPEAEDLTYAPPAVETTEPIAAPFVLGISYNTPTWTDEERDAS